MKITKYIHSCVQIEKGLDRILFDPGKFTFAEGAVKPEQFQNLQAVVLTHYHPDHVDEDALRKIAGNNPNAVFLCNAEINRKLAEKGVASEVFEAGARPVASFVLKAFDAPHEAVLADELPQNTAYTVDDNVLHPGDSLSDNLLILKETPILCLPMMAPWGTELRVYDFAVRMAPQYAVPVHDGYVKDFFLESRYQTMQKYLTQKNVKFEWMSKPGDYLEV